MKLDSSRDDEKKSATCGVSYEGKPAEIGFNPSYLAETLAHIDGEVTARLNADGPSIFHDGNDPDVLFVLMPMRI